MSYGIVGAHGFRRASPAELPERRVEIVSEFRAVFAPDRSFVPPNCAYWRFHHRPVMAGLCQSLASIFVRPAEREVAPWHKPWWIFVFVSSSSPAAGSPVRVAARRPGRRPPASPRPLSPAAARRDAGTVRRSPGPVHAGVVHALVHLGERAAAGAGESAGAGGAGLPGAAATGPGRAGVRRYRRDAKAGLWPPEAGRGVRPHEDQGKSLLARG